MWLAGLARKLFHPSDKKSQTAPSGTAWDFYDDRKYISHDMQSSYLRSLVTRWRFVYIFANGKNKGFAR
jgi:hypothetical protein